MNLVEALRGAARNLREGAHYAWGSHGACNCGQVLQVVTHLSKEEIVRHGNELGVDFSLTVSCYEADAAGRACGDCEACRLRREGFRRAGLEDPTRYRG